MPHSFLPADGPVRADDSAKPHARLALDALHRADGSGCAQDVHLLEDDFGSSTRDLHIALTSNPEELADTFFDDLLRFLRVAAHHNYGDRVIAWMEETAHAEQQLPIYAAFKAFVRGDRFLLDINPEVRRPAQKIYAWLNSNQAPELENKSKAARKPSRRRKRLLR
jgi:hypothetical protein